MEQKQIAMKQKAGFIDNAVVVRKKKSEVTGNGYYFVIYFFDKDQKIPLTKQRGNIREFAELSTAANVIEKIGLRQFAVSI